MIRHITLGSQTTFQIKIIPVTSLDIVILSLTIFGFMFLYYYVCDDCSDMLTCLFFIMFFFSAIKITKILSIKIINTITYTKNNSSVTGLRDDNGQFLLITDL